MFLAISEVTKVDSMIAWKILSVAVTLRFCLRSCAKRYQRWFQVVIIDSVCWQKFISCLISTPNSLAEDTLWTSANSVGSISWVEDGLQKTSSTVLRRLTSSDITVAKKTYNEFRALQQLQTTTQFRSRLSYMNLETWVVSELAVLFATFCGPPVFWTYLNPPLVGSQF